MIEENRYSGDSTDLGDSHYGGDFVKDSLNFMTYNVCSNSFWDE